MKRAVIYYSKTGNTKSVVDKLSDFDVLRVVPESDNPNIANPVLKVSPNAKDYERIVFASPVHGFQLSRVMQAYFEQCADLENKTVDLFVTHQFPFAWLGGNQTLKQMKKLVENKKGKVRFMTSINWSSKKRTSVIEEMINIYNKNVESD
jgi:menaquinone-dependent protoporphyrinogen IX oxidase